MTDHSAIVAERNRQHHERYLEAIAEQERAVTNPTREALEAAAKALRPFAEEAVEILTADAETRFANPELKPIPDDMSVEDASIAGTPINVGHLREARSALALVTAELAKPEASPAGGRVAEGWAVVPKVAVRKMVNAGRREFSDSLQVRIADRELVQTWSAMISAAPPAPDAPEAGAEVHHEHTDNPLTMWAEEGGVSVTAEPTIRGVKLTLRHSNGLARPTLEAVATIAWYRWERFRRLSARPSPGAGTKPVAWRVKDLADGWVLCRNREQAQAYSFHNSDSLIEPLYTYPQLSEKP